MTWTNMAVGTLAQCVGVHLVQKLLTLPHGEQATGLLPLAPQPLWKGTCTLRTHMGKQEVLT
jgi:hypothetical protein